MPVPHERVLELEREVKEYGKKYRQEIEELERKIDTIVKELKHIANITIILEEEEDDKQDKIHTIRGSRRSLY